MKREWLHGKVHEYWLGDGARFLGGCYSWGGFARDSSVVLVGLKFGEQGWAVVSTCKGVVWSSG